jgi:Zn-dependent metalloprotease
MLRDPTVLIHESIHAVIDAYAGLPPDGEGGGFNEGFADLFTALILDNPRMGEASYLKGPYRRTLENPLKAYQDFVPGVYQNGSIVGGTFWDMKPLLGNELTAKLAFRTLVRLGKGAKFDDFPSALAGASQGLLADDQSRQVAEIARARGWKVP